ncbi:hypothetical protein EV175_005344 [Coemansia sp. RSA 1933]|nr:hypothetical protein EV175_005344 [Coemansia sp. RSA 1933]
MISISIFSSLLFSMDVVAAAACCAHMAIHAAIVRKDTISDLDDARTITVVERYVFWMSVATLAATVVFGVLDLGGAAVLRSSMWRRSFGQGKWQQQEESSPDLVGAKMLGHADWLYHTDGIYDGGGCYRAAVQKQPAWWQVVFKELAYAVQRNSGFIRLATALLLMLLWSPAIVQVAIVGYTGQCRMAASDKDLDVVCDLLRKALVAGVIVWASWSAIAVLLLFVNTTSAASVRATKHLLPYHIPVCGHPPMSVPGVAGGARTAGHANAPASGMYRTNGALLASRRSSNIRSLVQMGQVPYNQGLFHPYQQIHHHPYASAAASTTGPREPGNAQYRASWSHTDGGESVISSDPGKPEPHHSIFHSQTKAHVLHHMHQLHSLNQFQPPSRISEEQPETNGDLYAALPGSLAMAYSSAQRRARAAFYKTKYSTSISGGLPDPLVNTPASSSAEKSSLPREAAGGGSAQQRHYRHHGSGPPPLPAGGVLARVGVARSLARLSYESCDIDGLGGGDPNGGGGIGGGGWRSDSDSRTKRNTIG